MLVCGPDHHLEHLPNDSCSDQRLRRPDGVLPLLSAGSRNRLRHRVNHQILLIIFLGSLLAYGAATSHLPYRDAHLLAADRWLGFGLQAYLSFVNARPWLASLSLVAYTTMLWQAALIFAVLTLTRLAALNDCKISPLPSSFHWSSP